MPLKLTQANKWIKVNSKRIIAEYGLGHWTIGVKVLLSNDDGKEEDDHFGNTTVYFDYSEADIKLYVDKMPNIKYFEDTFRHELCHVVAAPIDLLEAIIEAGGTAKERKLRNHISRYVDEALAIAIDNALKCHRRIR